LGAQTSCLQLNHWENETKGNRMVKELNIIIPSSKEFVGPIMSFLYALFKNKGIEETVVSNVVTSVIEAVANAINHGNRADLNKKIEISVCVDRNKLNIEVQDEGEGFDVTKLPDPLAPENLLKPTGRGIFLIKAFMDNVDFDFKGKGAKLIMEKVFDRTIE
jgi:serine/threonine-protein kinase RsbW